MSLYIKCSERIMARLPRICPVGIPQHVIQRGNNHQVCFACDQDIATYAGWLKEYSIKFSVEIHAWVFMTNHVHLLCTPRSSGAISFMMQAIGRQYVRYFNIRYKRTGTLWEGRYKSCLVQEESYLLRLYLYIELNPVRANMVDEPSKYSWSSYQINALGKESELCTPHPLYIALGESKSARLDNYQQLFNSRFDGNLLIDIRLATKRGTAVGTTNFFEDIETLTGCKMTQMKRGRPKQKFGSDQNNFS